MWRRVAVLALLLLFLLVCPVRAGRLGVAVSVAYQDAQKLQAAGLLAQELQAYRYFWVSTPAGKARESFRAGFKLHLNMISRNSEIIDVVEVAPDLWRLDIDEIEWDRATLEAARFVDPFFHDSRKVEELTILRPLYWPGGVDSRDGKFTKKSSYRETIQPGEKITTSAAWLPVADTKKLRELLFTEVPILHAEWFLVQSSRQLSLANQQTGLGYYDFLQLKDRDDWFKLVGFSEKNALAFGREIRAIQEISGVSPAPRQLVRPGLGGGGAIWVALDTNDPRKDGIAINKLERNTFKHQIEEWYGPLANGLPGTFLSDQNGNRANNAPADAAGFRDDSRLNESKDGRIHVNLACLRCHAGQVLLPIQDYVRETFQHPTALSIAALEEKDLIKLSQDERQQILIKKRVLNLRKQYFSDLEEALVDDRVAYQKIFLKATVTAAYPRGLSAQKAVEAYARAFHDYADDREGVSQEKAARELGISLALWKAALLWQLHEIKKLDIRLVGFTRDPPRTLSRLTWEDAYQEAQDTVARYLIAHPGENHDP